MFPFLLMSPSTLLSNSAQKDAYVEVVLDVTVLLTGTLVETENSTGISSVNHKLYYFNVKKGPTKQLVYIIYYVSKRIRNMLYTTYFSLR